MSFESPQTRLFLQQYLLNQLVATNNVYTKIKVLRLFQVVIPCVLLRWFVVECVHVCEPLQVLLDDGHFEFKQNLRKHPEAFNEASSKYMYSVLVCVY